MTDPMMWQLQLDMLIAEANVYANEAMQLLHEAKQAYDAVESEEQRAAAEDAVTDQMRTVYAKVDAWAVIQDEIQHHIDQAKGDTP